MRNIIRTLASVVLLAFLFTLTSLEARAATCTDQYAACINVSGQMAEPFQTLADIECGLEYTGCVANKLKFW